MTSMKTVVAGFFFCTLGWPAAHALPTQIPGTVTYQTGMNDLMGKPFEPTKCQLTALKSGDDLSFDLQFTTDGGNDVTSYVFTVPSGALGNLPDEKLPNGVDVESLDSNMSLSYEPDGQISLTAKHPASEISINLTGLNAGKYEVVTKWQYVKVNIIGEEVQLEVRYVVPVYDVLSMNNNVISKARCTLDKPLLP